MSHCPECHDPLTHPGATSCACGWKAPYVQATATVRLPATTRRYVDLHAPENVAACQRAVQQQQKCAAAPGGSRDWKKRLQERVDEGEILPNHLDRIRRGLL